MTKEKPLDFLFLGPAYPYRGGIAVTQQALAKSLQEQGYQVKLWTFTALYPAFLFPGKTQFSNEPETHGLLIEQKIHAYSPFQWNKIAAEINRLQPKQVVFRYWTPFLSPCWQYIGKRLSGSIKKVGWVDNWQAHEPKPWDKYLTKNFEKTMDLFTTLSPAIAAEIARSTKKEVWGKMHPIENKLPKKISQKNARTKLNLAQEETLLLFFGLIRPYKGLALLLAALKQQPDKHLMVVGECYEDWKKYQKLIQEYGLEKQITRNNCFVSQAEAALYFSAANAIVLPYTSATQSGVLALAYHYETPLVVTDHPGLSQAVLEDTTGIVCAPSVEGLSNAIKAVTTQNTNKAFSENLKQSKHRYSWEVYAKEWANFIFNA